MTSQKFAFLWSYSKSKFEFKFISDSTPILLEKLIIFIVSKVTIKHKKDED